MLRRRYKQLAATWSGARVFMESQSFVSTSTRFLFHLLDPVILKRNNGLLHEGSLVSMFRDMRIKIYHWHVARMLALSTYISYDGTLIRPRWLEGSFTAYIWLRPDSTTDSISNSSSPAISHSPPPLIIMSRYFHLYLIIMESILFIRLHCIAFDGSLLVFRIMGNYCELLWLKSVDVKYVSLGMKWSEQRYNNESVKVIGWAIQQ